MVVSYTMILNNIIIDNMIMILAVNLLLSNFCSFHIHALKVPKSPIKVFYDSKNSLHRDIQYHPEQPSRIDKCLDVLKSYHQENEEKHKLHHVPLFELINVSRTVSSSVEQQTSQIYYFSLPFLSKARNILTEIHTEELVSSIETTCHNSRQRRINEGKDPLGFIGNLDHDTFLTTESYDVCLRATAIWMHCVDIVLSNGATSTAMALTRPPGHHATKTLPNGFCIFNFAAAAAVHALTVPTCNKVTIIDWDVHYGQGVADIVSKNPNIRYVSMHQVPAFPYLGQSRSIIGEHSNIKTVPIQAESTWACGYESAFVEQVLPFCYEDGVWEADLVIVCAGYDALSSDELASCNLNGEDYGKMTTLLKNHLEDQFNHIGLVFGLEGGYQLNDSPGGNLADAVLETLKAAGK